MALDLSSLKIEGSRLKTGGSNQNQDYLSNFVKFPEGNGAVVVRLLGPAMDGMFERNDSPFYQATRIHKVNEKSFHCPKELDKTSGKFFGECPICRYYNYLWQESEKLGEEDAKKMQARARAIKPIDRFYYNCIVRGDDSGPKILSIGKTLHQMIITGIVGNEELQETGYGDVTDHVSGRDFKIIKTMRTSGKDTFPNYDSSKFLDPSPLGDPTQIKAWLASVHDLVALRTVRDQEELKIELKKHLGVIANDTSGFDPREYEQNLGSDDEVVVNHAHTHASPTSHSHVESTTTDDSSVPMGEEEFFKNLRTNVG